MKLPNNPLGSSRRDLFRTGLMLAGASALSAAPSNPNLTFPIKPQDRLAVTSYPFRTLIESPTNPARDRTKPGMDLKEFPAMVKKRFGIVNINPLGDHLSSTEPAYLDSFREAVAKAGSHLVDLGIGGRDFASADQRARNEAVAYGRLWIDIAAAVGSPSIRQHLRIAKGVSPSVENAAQSLSRLADYGAQHGVIVNLENDSLVAEDPFFIVSVLAKVNHPFLRALPDFGNSIRKHDSAYNSRAVDAMLKHAYNMCHVKDVLHTPDGKDYRVDLPAMFQLANANSYRGYFSMEFDTNAGEPFSGTDNFGQAKLALPCSILIEKSPAFRSIQTVVELRPFGSRNGGRTASARSQDQQLSPVRLSSAGLSSKRQLPFARRPHQDSDDHGAFLLVNRLWHSAPLIWRSNKRKYAVTEFKAFVQSARRYIKITTGDPIIHRSVVQAVNGLREFLQVERKRIPGDILFEADRLDCQLSAGYDLSFNGD